MRGVAVQEQAEAGEAGRPDEAARKRVAVELIRNHDRPLRWTARKYSICPEDAEDAYQRGIEILLSKAPTADPRQLLPWARTVIKHEALAIRKTRERTLARPGRLSDDDQSQEDWVSLIPSSGDGPDELAVRRERVARSREALALLKPAELKALTQLAEGFSYDEIGALNDWTRTKVNRCLAEGRARFRNAFHESEAGERCSGFEPLISASCDGELGADEYSRLEKHLAACGHCRATLRAYRAAPKAAAALAPVIPFGRGIWDRFQELLVDLQMRVQGVGRGSDSAFQSVMVSGGTRGAGVAAIAKLAAICAGTAGTAAVCAATGILPTAGLVPDRKEEPRPTTAAVAREAKPRAVPMEFTEADEIPEAPIQDKPEQVPVPPDPVAPVTVVEEEPVVVQPAPVPTPTETEFTPEAAGTPAPAAAPPPQPTSNQVPVSNGGGEFAP
jgi:RNA polymerase sigma factor (sigma-70 family)